VFAGGRPAGGAVAGDFDVAGGVAAGGEFEGVLEFGALVVGRLVPESGFAVVAELGAADGLGAASTISRFRSILTGYCGSVVSSEISLGVTR